MAENASATAGTVDAGDGKTGGRPISSHSSTIESSTQEAIRTIQRLADQAILSTSNGHDPSLSDLDGCPELPAEARIDPAIGKNAGAWLDGYTAYASQISPMTPRIFHESAGLWLISTAIGRRLVLPMSFDQVYPNLFIAWIAPTTLWNKTTALNVARDTARSSFPHLLLPQDTTPESFLADLAGREPDKLDQMTSQAREIWERGRNFAAQRGLLLDEMSGLLASAGKDYGAGLVESFLRLYDCDPQYTRSTRGQGWMVVKDAYLSLLGASTPAALAAHLTNERLWAMGWWPRFSLLAPETKRPIWLVPPAQVNKPDALISSLQQLYTALPVAKWPDPPTAKTVTLGTGVFDAWQRYSKAVRYDLITDSLDRRLWGAYGRLAVHALKVSTILAAMDWKCEGAPVIELYHLARAVAITEDWRASAHRVLRTATETEYDRLQERVLYQCGRHDKEGGATLRNLYISMRDRTPAELTNVVEQLVKVGMLEEISIKAGPTGGRPTMRYRLTRD